MRETRNPVSDAARHCAVEVITMTAMVVTFPIVPPASVIGFALWCVVALAVLTVASRVLEHRYPDWRVFFRVGWGPDYELLAFAAALVVLLVAAAIINAVPVEIVANNGFLKILPFYAAGVAGSVTKAIGRVWVNGARS